MQGTMSIWIPTETYPFVFVNLDYFLKMWVIHIPLTWEIIIFNVKTLGFQTRTVH